MSSKLSQALNVMSDFDPSKINVSELKLLESGAKLGYVNYVRGRCGLETPEVYLPFDYTDPKKMGGDTDKSGDSAGKGKPSLVISLKNRGEDADMDRLLDVIEAVDNRVIDIGVENAIKWGIVKAGKKVDRDIVDNVYNPSIKLSLNKDTGEQLPYPPQLRVKLPQDKSGAITTEVYNQNGQRVYFKDPSEVFRKGTRIRGIIECTGLWCSQKFGLTWKLTKAVVQDSAERSSSVGFTKFKPSANNQASADTSNAGAGASGDASNTDDYDAYDSYLKPNTTVNASSASESVLDAVLPSAPVSAPAPVPTDDDDEEEDGDDMPKAPVPSRVPTRPAVSGAPPVFGRKRKPTATPTGK